MRRIKPGSFTAAIAAALERPIVLVGLMGAGKSSIGRLLATRLGLDFVDADCEIEDAAGSSIEEIFASRGEAEFRSGERRVIARLLTGPVRVIATGGGAFMDDETRTQIKDAGLSIWLKADLETLLRRVSRRGGRPLLKDQDPRDVMVALMDQRDPTYAEADITVETSENPPAEVADRVIAAIAKHLGIEVPDPPANRQARRGRPKVNGENPSAGGPRATSRRRRRPRRPPMRTRQPAGER